MAEITKLRHLTSAGLMDCKKALAETDGDIDAAVEILRKKGQAVAAKREDRVAAEGCVLSKNEGNFAAVVALQCETDFVAKNAGFVELTQKLLDLAVANRCKSLDELKAVVVDGRTVADLVVEEGGKTGEKTELGAYEYVEAPSTTSYNHLGNKLATIAGFNLEGVDFQVGRDVAMQVASMNPIAVDRDSVDQSVIDNELRKPKRNRLRRPLRQLSRKPVSTPTSLTAKPTSNPTSPKAGLPPKRLTRLALSPRKQPRPRLQTSPNR